MMGKSCALERRTETVRQVANIEQTLVVAYAYCKGGQWGKALHLCQQVLDANPDHAHALHLMGLVAFSSGNWSAALDYMRQACAKPGSTARFHSDLAEILRQSNQLAEAEVVSRRAVAMDTSHVAGWTNLGLILQATGQLEESLLCLSRVCQMDPGNAEGHGALGDTLARLGHEHEARAEYQTAIALDPNNVRVHCNLARLLTEQGRYEAAMHMARQAIEINPACADGYLHAATIAQASGHMDEALDWLSRALTASPGHPGALLAQARLLEDVEDFPAALRAAQRAVAALPQSGEAHEVLGLGFQRLSATDQAMVEYDLAANLPHSSRQSPLEKKGKLLLDLGRSAEALAVFDRALDFTPRSGSLWFNRSQAKTFSLGDPDIAMMERILAEGIRQGIDWGERIFLLFALGKACLDSGEEEQAFTFLAKANQLKRATFDYDVRGAVHEMEAAALSSAQMTRLRRSGDPSGLPIFVIGMPHSGTAVVERLLAGHPSVHGAGERRLLGNVVQPLRQSSGNVLAFSDALTSGGMAWMARRYLDRLSALAPTKSRIVDSMPTNFLYAGLIHLLFPQARILHCRRDPVETCLSCYETLFTQDRHFAYDQGELAAFYRGYDRLAKHWASILPADRYTEVSYETLLKDPDGEARRLLTFCGLDAHELQGRPLVRGHSLGAGRWGSHARHLAELLELKACR